MKRRSFLKMLLATVVAPTLARAEALPGTDISIPKPDPVPPCDDSLTKTLLEAQKMLDDAPIVVDGRIGRVEGLAFYDPPPFIVEEWAKSMAKKFDEEVMRVAISN